MLGPWCGVCAPPQSPTGIARAIDLDDEDSHITVDTVELVSTQDDVRPANLWAVPLWVKQPGLRGPRGLRAFRRGWVRIAALLAMARLPSSSLPVDLFVELQKLAEVFADPRLGSWSSATTAIKPGLHQFPGRAHQRDQAIFDR